jgi:hypothetical protein
VSDERDADGPAPDGVTLAPVETDTSRIVAVGTAAFTAAFVLLLVLRFSAPDWTRDHPDWLWIALAGAVLGLLGLVIVGRHRRLGRTR